MTSICFYFQVHQPYRVKEYSVFDIGSGQSYFDEVKNEEVTKKVARKCYLPTNKLLLDLIKEHQGRFKISFSITGTAIEQFEKYTPEVIQSFKELAETGCVEFLAETYHHSLSWLKSKDEFKKQIEMHAKKIKELFGQEPKVFRNTELIFNNEIAHDVEEMGYKGIIAEGADKILGWRSPDHLYKAKTTDKIKLLLKNYKLSDDIAFRFSNKGWEEHPLTVDKYTHWIKEVQGECVNLFMDYETFGEHQWEDTGIFEFMRHLPGRLMEHGHIDFKTPSELVDSYEVKDELDVHHIISWADMERDITAWQGNKMQVSALNMIYDVEKEVMLTNDTKLIDDWRKLTTSDHYYYMCTKWFSDGDVHKYFSPYESPYDSFIYFMNVLNDLKMRIQQTQERVEVDSIE